MKQNEESLHLSKVYTKLQCQSECVNNLAMEEFNCILEPLSKVYESFGRQDLIENFVVCNFTENELFNQLQVKKNLTSTTDLCMDCLPSCDYIDYETNIGENEILPEFKNTLYFDYKAVSQ